MSLDGRSIFAAFGAHRSARMHTGCAFSIGLGPCRRVDISLPVS
jgi:hypothetical protein